MMKIVENNGIRRAKEKQQQQYKLLLSGAAIQYMEGVSKASKYDACFDAYQNKKRKIIATI